MSGAPADLVAALAALEEEAGQAIRSAGGREALQQLRTDVLGRKSGRLTSILKELPGLDPDHRRVVGQRANAVKAALEQLLDEADARVAAADQGARAADLTMPARPVWRGAKHPSTLVIERINRIFGELGFTRYVGPEAETDWHNFWALNFPHDHPAVDAHDTLYLAGGFGFHMDVPNVIDCGLQPGFHPSQIELAGNTALAGAYLALVDSNALQEVKKIIARVETVELNLDPNFETHYIEQLSLPKPRNG